MDQKISVFVDFFINVVILLKIDYAYDSFMAEVTNWFDWFL